MTPYNYPQIRIAGIENLPETSTVTWNMEFYGYGLHHITLMERDNYAIVYIAEEVHGTLILTPTVDGSSDVVDPITLEIYEKPNAQWIHGGQDSQTAVVMLVPESFRPLAKGSSFYDYPYEYFACHDSRKFLDISQATEVRVIIQYNYPEDSFLEVLCQDFYVIDRIGNEIIIRNPKGPVFFKFMSPQPCQTGYMDVEIQVTEPEWRYRTEHLELVASTQEIELVAPIQEIGLVAPIQEIGLVAPIPEIGMVAPIPEIGMVAPIQEIELGAPIQETLWVASFPEDLNVCDYTLNWDVEHYPNEDGTKTIPRMIDLNSRTLAFTTRLSECTPLAQPLSPGVVEIFPRLTPKFNGLPIIQLEPLYMTLTLGGCSAPESSS